MKLESLKVPFLSFFENVTLCNTERYNNLPVNHSSRTHPINRVTTIAVVAQQKKDRAVKLHYITRHVRNGCYHIFATMLSRHERCGCNEHFNIKRSRRPDCDAVHGVSEFNLSRNLRNF